LSKIIDYNKLQRRIVLKKSVRSIRF